MILIDSILEFFFPTRCLVCCREGGDLFCARCRESVRILDGPLCLRCGEPLEDAAGSMSPVAESRPLRKPESGGSRCCAQCALSPPAFVRARGVAAYEGSLKKAIQKFKYNGMRRLAVPLASILAQFLQGEDFCGPIDFVAPLPLHPSKEAARGYNQSALIGEVLAGEMGIHFEARLLERTRPTRPQSKLPREERVGNVRGAFRTLGDPSGRAVLLIDDVMTTGATLREASAALNGAGAKEVYCLCVAKDLLRMPRR